MSKRDMQQRLMGALIGMNITTKMDPEDLDGHTVYVYMSPQAKVTVSVYGNEDELKYYVNYSHMNGDFICMEGTDSMHMALFNLGYIKHASEVAKYSVPR